jgi:predicted nucleotidyltransferase component of viral defense system
MEDFDQQEFGMITRKELAEFANVKGLNLGYAEKDYLLDLMLFSLSKNTKDELVFKGGTCLYKLYGLNRFSEDLDFTARAPIDLDFLLDRMRSDLSLFGVGLVSTKKRRVHSSSMFRLRFEGPLYTGAERSLTTVRLDINTGSSVDLIPEAVRHVPDYPDVPPFTTLAMDLREILAEKVRAITSRTRARDVYDTWFLVRKGVEFDRSIADKKLDYYEEKFDASSFAGVLEEFRKSWVKELRPFLKNVPDFDEVKSLLLERVAG